MPSFSDYKKIFIIFFKRHKRLPSYSEMMELFGFKSKNAVAKVVDKLTEAGLVAKDDSGKLVPLPSMTGTLLLGNVQAGMPTHAEEEIGEAVSLDEYLIERKDATYLLEVNGDSMIDAGIQEGDLVVVEQGKEPHHGEIVIAEVDSEWTMKYYIKQGSRIILRPANKKYRDIIPENQLRIGGIVRGVVRKY